ncbi:uncharacterized protein PGRI_086110 [Penicillium griseofulvum]|uniref:Uncharacterized protein n=1 Tax=Penicillium patulum TaxID=5078 RepID=A0A135LTK7_PENPA|nr:uncharacterized protein PGRI_086110 [Penicillium griseofulvum]KXG52327.1 hypothetical protein PGRI_086110 [Penicillium griseofulvum]
MAAVRLRKAFRYPEESEGEREELDEEEQERVIEELQRQNDARNAQYSMIFTTLPLLAATIFVPSVLSASSQAERLFSLLGLVSLLTTAYIMKCSPLQPDHKGKKPMTSHTELMLAVILLAQKVMLSVDLASLKDLQYEYKGA